MRKRSRGKGRERKEREKRGREEEAEMSELKREVTEHLCIRHVITLPYFCSAQESHDWRSIPLLQNIWQNKNDEC